MLFSSAVRLCDTERIVQFFFSKHRFTAFLRCGFFPQHSYISRTFSRVSQRYYLYVQLVFVLLDPKNQHIACRYPSPFRTERRLVRVVYSMKPNACLYDGNRMLTRQSIRFPSKYTSTMGPDRWIGTVDAVSSIAINVLITSMNKLRDHLHAKLFKVKFTE